MRAKNRGEIEYANKDEKCSDEPLYMFMHVRFYINIYMKNALDKLIKCLKERICEGEKLINEK